MVLMISLFFPIYTKIQTWDLFPSEMPLWLLSDAFNNIQRLGFYAAKFSARKKAEKRSCPGTLQGFRDEVCASCCHKASLFEPVRASRSDWQLIGVQAPAGNAAPVTGLSAFRLIPAGNCRRN